MNKNIIDLVTPVATKNEGSKEKKLEELVLETLEKFDVQPNEHMKELKFVNFNVSRYQQSHIKSVFGEKQSLSYTFQFVTYNLEYTVKLLAFQYDNKMEILKLDIEPQNFDTKKELEYCCNYLKRRRNLNLLFISIVQFSRFIEARRLICDLILKKCNRVNITKNKDGGLIIVYDNEQVYIKFGIIWNIVCNSMQEISDVVEVYYKNVECPNKDSIKQRLIKVTHPNLSFTAKYHIWRELFQDLNRDVYQSLLTTSVFSNSHHAETLNKSKCKASTLEIMDTSEANGIVFVSDSEDSASSSAKSFNSGAPCPVPNQTMLVCNRDVNRTNLYCVPSVISSLVQLGSQVNHGIEGDFIPAKKCRKNQTDDDLEITSVTYVVPD